MILELASPNIILELASSNPHASSWRTPALWLWKRGCDFRIWHVDNRYSSVECIILLVLNGGFLYFFNIIAYTAFFFFAYPFLTIKLFNCTIAYVHYVLYLLPTAFQYFAFFFSCFFSVPSYIFWHFNFFCENRFITLP